MPKKRDIDKVYFRIQKRIARQHIDLLKRMKKAGWITEGLFYYKVKPYKDILMEIKIKKIKAKTLKQVKP